jgi:hypothetical protein
MPNIQSPQQLSLNLGAHCLGLRVPDHALSDTKKTTSNICKTCVEQTGRLMMPSANPALTFGESGHKQLSKVSIVGARGTMMLHH